jgi:hypothetical protein
MSRPLSIIALSSTRKVIWFHSAMWIRGGTGNRDLAPIPGFMPSVRSAAAAFEWLTASATVVKHTSGTTWPPLIGMLHGHYQQVQPLMISEKDEPIGIEVDVNAGAAIVIGSDHI